MKLNCNIEVVNRSIPMSNVPRRKAQRSSLAIAKQSVKNSELLLLLQTTQNKSGTKYKIDDNIEKVFTKFVNDGKTTIRLREPPHDLNIQCDAIQLKSFLHTLKLGLTKKLDPAVLCVSNLNPKPIVATPRTKVVVKTKADYPVLQGFPRTTEELTIAGLERKSFDRQILRLQSLRVLNLSGNLITSLPRELGGLPHLAELIASRNLLGRGAAGKWAWLTEGTLTRTLRRLDLSGNDLFTLPDQIGSLTNLITLNVSENSLTSLPQKIGVLPSLKDLDVSHNRLTALPGSTRNLRLMSLNIANNPLAFTDVSFQSYVEIPSLRELGGRAVLNNRLHYNSSIIPYTLVPYLNNAFYCICSRACIDTYLRKMIGMNLSKITNSVTSSGITVVPFDCVFCSIKCYTRFGTVEFRL